MVARTRQDIATVKERGARRRIQEKVGRKYGHLRCPSGQIERAGYTRRTYTRKPYTRRSGSKVAGTRVRATEVPPVCITATSYTGRAGRSRRDIAAIEARRRIQEKVGREYGHVRCPPGQIERAGYTRRAYTRKPYTRRS